MTANAKNLSTLANVLDDGTNGQFLQSTGSGGIVFADVAAGASVYDSAELLPLSGNDAGDMAYVNSTNRFYINNGTGWYSISLVNTNPNITSVQDASANTTPFTLATDGTATVITITANDPEQVPLTYNYSVTSGSLTNGGGTTATVTQSDNVFTVTPTTTEAYAGTFSLTFTASDGINTATSANSFTLQFITIVTDSKYTTLLATATGTSDNNNITDNSTNNHSITVNGDAHAGTFSPYRSGGYSILFDNTTAGYSGSGSYSIRYAEGTTSDFNMGTNAFTIEGWIKPYDTSSGSRRFYQNRYSSTGNGRGSIFQSGSGLYMSYRGDDGTDYELGPYSVLTANTWTHFCLLRNTSDNTLKLYADGTLLGSISVPSSVGIYNSGSNTYIGDGFAGEMADIRVINGTALAPPAGGPSAKLENVTNTVLLLNGPNLVDYSGIAPIHNDPYIYDTPTLKTLSPYDYLEYAATDHGGSVYFDGSGDSLNTTATQIIPSTSFTVTAWVYLNDTTNGAVWGQGTAGHSGRTGITIDSNNWFAQIGSANLGTSTSVSANRWYYTDFQWDGSTLKFFVDGTLLGSVSNSNSPTNSAFYIGDLGSAWSTGFPLNGYVSDLKVVSGTPSGSSTIPTAPLSSSGASLHIKGTDASIIDKSQGGNLKLEGNTTGSTTQVKFSNTKSMYFDGSGDYIPIITNFFYDKNTSNASTTKFTIETWVYHTARLTYSGYNHIFQTIVGLGNVGLSFGIGPSGNLKFYHQSASTNVVTSTSTISLNTWTHIAVIVDGSQGSSGVTLKINGTTDGTGTWNGISTSQSDQSTPYSSPHFTIGRYPDSFQSHQQFAGYLQDLRISSTARTITSAPTASLEG